MHFEPAIAAPGEPTSLAWSFAFVEGQLLMREGDDALAPGPAHDAPERHYMGRLDGIDAWALRLESAPPGWQRVPLRAAMMAMAAPHMSLASRAAQLIEWDRTHRHCGVCGTPTELMAHERARRCPACGHLAYPRVTPAMMVLVWRPGELLLARSPRFAPGVYSALAGFVEAGESLEQCVVRETAEEVGVQVGDLRYFGSQSWPFPNSLMIAFRAEYAGGDLRPDPAELADAQWFTPESLPQLPPRMSIARALIDATLAELG